MRGLSDGIARHCDGIPSIKQHRILRAFVPRYYDPVKKQWVHKDNDYVSVDSGSGGLNGSSTFGKVAGTAGVAGLGAGVGAGGAFAAGKLAGGAAGGAGLTAVGGAGGIAALPPTALAAAPSKRNRVLDAFVPEAIRLPMINTPWFARSRRIVLRFWLCVGLFPVFRWIGRCR